MSISLEWVKQMIRFRVTPNRNRNMNLWVFGCWGGNKYSDNSKAMFEYILEKHPHISAVWITKKYSIFQELKEENKPCFLAGTPDARKVLRNAGVAFYTNSILDFGDIDYLNGAVKVALFHGVGFKLELRELTQEKSNLGITLRILKHKLYCESFADVICTTSSFMREKFARQQYNADIAKIEITGQPRNDIFKYRPHKIDDRKVITYLPTWREDKVSQEKLQEAINQLVNSDDLEKILGKNNAKFIVKPHYLTKVTLNKKRKNIYVYNDTDIPDVQKALLDTDILITDYSSAASDFALLDRPIIFYDFDYETYKHLLADEYQECLRYGYASNNNELLSLLSDVLDGKTDLRLVDEVINRYCNSPKLQIGEFCENVFKVVNDKVKHKRLSKS
jgi:CDP-glycerol glycerophosphotransferase (TagB/SpsB family)